MNKRIVARVGSYINKQTGEEKKEYQNLGVILTGENGEYGLLDPCINLAGVLLKQNILAAKEGKPLRDKVAFSIFSDDPKPQQTQQQPQHGNPQPYQQQQAPQGQQPYQQQPPFPQQ